MRKSNNKIFNWSKLVFIISIICFIGVLFLLNYTNNIEYINQYIFVNCFLLVLILTSGFNWFFIKLMDGDGFNYDNFKSFIFDWDTFGALGKKIFIIGFLLMSSSLLSIGYIRPYTDITTINENKVKLENQKVDKINNKIWDEDGTWYKVSSDNYPDAVVKKDSNLDIDGKYKNGDTIFFPENINKNSDNISNMEKINNQ